MTTTVRTRAPEARFVPSYELRTATDGKYLQTVVTTYNEWHDVGPFEERMTPGVFGTSPSMTSSLNMTSS